MNLGMVLRRAAGGPVTINSIPKPWISLHRGGGGYVAPDNAPQSWAWSAAAAGGTATSLVHMFLDGDIQTTSDSQLVMLHDTTVDRTTDGTGSVSSMTLATFQALNMDPENSTPPILGWSHEHPGTFSDFLTVAKNARLPVLVEAKNSTETGATLSLINSMGMGQQVIVAVHSFPEVTQCKTAGVQSMYVVAPAPDQATLIASAPEHYAYDVTDATATDSYLSAVSASGINVWGATLRRRSDWATQQARPGVIGMASDDPFYMVGQNVVEDSLDLSSGRYHHGMIESTKGNVRPGVVGGSPGKMTFNFTNSQWCMVGSMAGASIPTRITWTVTYDAIGSSTSRWAGIGFGCPTDKDFYNHSAVTDNRGQGYICGMRATGDMLLSRADGDNIALVSLTNLVTTAVTAGQSVNFQMDYNPTTHVITFKRLDTGAQVTATDANYSGPYIHVGKNVQATGFNASFSNIAVVR